MKRLIRWTVCVALFASIGAPARAEGKDSLVHWIGAWGTAQPLALPAPPPAIVRAPPRPDVNQPVSPIPPIPQAFENQTVRMIVRPTVAGEYFRIQFSNAAGAEPVTFAAARVAKSAGRDRIELRSIRSLTFAGHSETTIAPGTVALSDPIRLELKAFDDVSISVFVRDKTLAQTVHPLGLRTTYVANGDQTNSSGLTDAQTNRSYFWLSGLLVQGAAEAGSIVAFGDSITDGYATTPDSGRAWPELLARRLKSDALTSQMSVLNMGFSGNRVRRDGAGVSALARFDRDVLARPGVRWVILLEGINDINMSSMPSMPAVEKTTAGQLIAAYSQIIDRAHVHGIKVMGATIGPTEGLWLYGAESEAMRQEVNRWIRSSGRFDAVVDFDAALRDPARPTRLKAEFDPGDHIHPNDAGNEAMATAIDLQVFKK